MSSVVAHVVVVGSFNVDHVWHCPDLPRPGETLVGSYRSGPGGKGFNQAVAAARAGAPTAFVCALGDDAGGQLARQLADADCITLRDLRSDAPTGTAGIYVDAGGRNSIVIGPGANATLSSEFVIAQGDLVARADVLLAQLESPLDSIYEAMRLARCAGIPTLLNPAPANAPCSRELLAVTDILTPNETEFATLLSRHAQEDVDPDTLQGLDDSRLHRLCRTLLPRGTVVVTLGAAGAFVSHRSDKTRGDDAESYRIPAETVEAIDTTGAGDAFNGALAASLAHTPGTPFVDHLRFAIRYAGLSTEREGAATTMPSRRELESRFPAP